MRQRSVLGSPSAPRELPVASLHDTTQRPRTLQLLRTPSRRATPYAHACGRSSVARCRPVARRRLGADQDARRSPRMCKERRLSVERQRARFITEPEPTALRHSAAVPLHAVDSPASPDAHRALHRRVHLDGMHGRPSGVSAGEILRSPLSPRDSHERHPSGVVLPRLPLHPTDRKTIAGSQNHLLQSCELRRDVLPHVYPDAVWHGRD